MTRGQHATAGFFALVVIGLWAAVALTPLPLIAAAAILVGLSGCVGLAGAIRRRFRDAALWRNTVERMEIEEGRQYLSAEFERRLRAASQEELPMALALMTIARHEGWSVKLIDSDGNERGDRFEPSGGTRFAEMMLRIEPQAPAR
jgi:hypothetical protein